MSGRTLFRVSAARNPCSLNFLQVRSAFKAAVERDPKCPVAARAVGSFVLETFVSIGLETFVPLPTPSAWAQTACPARKFVYLPAGTNCECHALLRCLQRRSGETL